MKELIGVGTQEELEELRGCTEEPIFCWGLNMVEFRCRGCHEPRPEKDGLGAVGAGMGMGPAKLEGRVSQGKWERRWVMRASKSVHFWAGYDRMSFLF